MERLEAAREEPSRGSMPRLFAPVIAREINEEINDSPVARFITFQVDECPSLWNTTELCMKPEERCTSATCLLD
jgi:hypothetical protein